MQEVKHLQSMTNSKKRYTIYKSSFCWGKVYKSWLIEMKAEERVYILLLLNTEQYISFSV